MKRVYLYLLSVLSVVLPMNIIKDLKGGGPLTESSRYPEVNPRPTPKEQAAIKRTGMFEVPNRLKEINQEQLRINGVKDYKNPRFS